MDILYRAISHYNNLPDNISKRIKELKFNSEQVSEKEHHWEQQDLLSEVALYLWKQKNFFEISCYTHLLKKDDIESKEDYGIECFYILKRLIDEINKQEIQEEKVYLYVMGFIKIGAYNSAIEVANNALSYGLNEEVEIKLRKEMRELYDKNDPGEEIAAKINQMRLLELLPQTYETYKDFLSVHRYNCSEEDKVFLIKILKEFEDIRFWQTVFDSLILDEGTFRDIYEAVSPSLNLTEEMYKIILDNFIDCERYKEAEELLKDIKLNRNIRSKEIDLIEIRLLIQTEGYDEANIKNEAILRMNPKCSDAIYNGALLLMASEKYDEALKQLNDCLASDLGIRVNLKIIDCYYYLKKVTEAKKIILQMIERNQIGLWLFRTWIAYNCYDPNFLIMALEALGEKFDIWGNNTDDAIIAKILKITNNIVDKGKVRFNLIKLLVVERGIKENLIFDEKGTKVYHYSKINLLKFLPRYYKKIGGSKLRLGNVAYLNDPSEGSTFYELLRLNAGTEERRIIEKLEQDGKIGFNNVYLTSFSTKKDFLPMWVQYANDAQGCCYVLNSTEFDLSENNVEEHLAKGLTDNRINYRGNKKSYVLYKVFYYDKDANSEVNGLVPLFTNILFELKDAIESSKNVQEMVMTIIDDVRYLIKDVAYKSEEELRVVCIDYDNEKLIDDTAEIVPHLYMEINKDLFYDEIVLGSKAQQIKAISAYLENCSNVGGVGLSKIKYV